MVFGADLTMKNWEFWKPLRATKNLGKNWKICGKCMRMAEECWRKLS
jgi:hypothetical protein